jgi:hypothetical protein
MQNKKKYCGNAKKIETTYGEMILVSLSKEDLVEVVGSNNKIYYNVCIAPRQAVGKYGDTHLVWVNPKKPQGISESAYSNAEKEGKQFESADEIPL